MADSKIQQGCSQTDLDLHRVAPKPRSQQQDPNRQPAIAQSAAPSPDRPKKGGDGPNKVGADRAARPTPGSVLGRKGPQTPATTQRGAKPRLPTGTAGKTLGNHTAAVDGFVTPTF
jgi:hypothetical protein